MRIVKKKHENTQLSNIFCFKEYIYIITMKINLTTKEYLDQEHNDKMYPWI